MAKSMDDICRYTKTSNEEKIEIDQDPAMAVEKCLAYLDIAIRKANKSKRSCVATFKTSPTDQVIDSNRLLSSLVLANHRDERGRRNSICSTEPKTQEVLKSAVTQMITANKLELYGIV